ncbi:MAG: ABC transporter ATP-binding protein/permease [Bifidobacteriaceae bacterium]|jgi:ATP-binding cassette subfamily B protein|nr:ABC transporter ATP-binding protein/permease [Bifidobacteriaceae bacterium]
MTPQTNEATAMPKSAQTSSEPTRPPAPSPKLGLLKVVGGRLVGIVVLSLVGSVGSVVPLIAVVQLARELAPGLTGAQVDPGRVWATAAVAAGALAASYAALGIGLIVSHLADADLQLDLRRRIVEHLRALPLGWFDAQSSGQVKKVAEDDVAALHQLVAHAIQDLIAALTVPVVSLVYLFAVDWRLALACLAPLAVGLVSYALMLVKSAPRYKDYDASLGRLNSATVEYVHGIAVVKAFGQAGRSHGRYRRETTGFATYYDEWNRDTNRFAAAGELATSPPVVLVCLAAAAAWAVTSSRTDPIDTLPALVLGLGLTAPMGKLEWSAQFLREAFKARKSLAEFLTQPTVSQPAEPRTPESSEVSFDDVSFSYDGERQVLQGITVDCPPGRVTALVGPSGSGKSTLARLLPRFYDADSGQVAIGRVDVRQIAADTLYSQVGFVFQDTYLLRATIRDNIRLTRPEATAAEVEQAARAAQIHQRVTRCPNGYDSVVGQDVHFSGGEAQRLMIARALITDAPILVLDEATAFADPDSEAAIQQGLSSLARQRTLVVIAHRLGTVTQVDQLLVVDAGWVVERGRHAELSQAGGLYQRMWRKWQALPAPAGPEAAS